MTSSSATGGRNPLKRVCNDCNATDKAITRLSLAIKKKKASGAQLGPEDVDVKADLVKLNADDKAAWYKAEKKRRQQDREGPDASRDSCIVPKSNSQSLGISQVDKD